MLIRLPLLSFGIDATVAFIVQQHLAMYNNVLHCHQISVNSTAMVHAPNATDL